MVSDERESLLSFVAAHEFVHADHVRRLLGIQRPEAEGRLEELVAGGLVRRERWAPGAPAAFRITRAGLAQLGSQLPVPRPGLDFRHQAGVVWMWLAAHRGSFGEAQRVLSVREMRFEDQHGGAGEEPRAGLDAAHWRPAGWDRTPFGVTIGDSRDRIRPAIHYPDLSLVMAAGRIPVQLQLLAPARRRLEAILQSFSDHGAAAVLYLVADPLIGRAVQSVAGWLGLSALVHVQPARLG